MRNRSRTPIEASPVPDFADSIDLTRKAPAVAVTALPSCPTTWQPTAADERLRRLRHLSEDHRAEALDAGEEVVARVATYAADFGVLVPDPAKVAWVLTELHRTLDAAHQIEQLRAFHAERAEILTHDLYSTLAEVHREYEHRVDRVPSLAERYRKLPALFAAIRKDISDGMAAAAARREAAAPKG
jgi:hypothetical protein